jgi:predicted nucleotidyltransferase
MTDRPTIDVASAPGGWPTPWRSVAEIASVLPTEKWTLVGGMLVQLHTIHHRLGVLRATNDVDIVLHIEVSRGLPAQTATALEAIGYQLLDSFDPHDSTAHRFVRGDSKVDLVAGTVESEIVDVLIAEHAAPAVVETLRGRDMIRIEGGTQALKRTYNARLEIEPGTVTTVSVPRPYGALILKSAAYTTDSRDRERHLFDAAALLACIEDPFIEREDLTGSDRRRLMTLGRALPQEHPAWRTLPSGPRANAEAALRILTVPGT